MTAPLGFAGGIYQRGPCLGDEQVTGLSIAKGLTPPSGVGATKCEVQIEGGAIRYRATGDNPTITVGTLQYDGDVLGWGEGQDLRKLKFIAVNGTPQLNVNYY